MSNDSFDDFVPDSQDADNESVKKAEDDNSFVADSAESQRPLHDTYVEEVDEREVRGESEVDDVIKILVATDIHCGYGENKPNINLDSINTFEEVLQIAIKQNVDMVLLGGDLFHENNPSREVQHKVTQLIRKYCLNGKPVALEFLSDASVNFNQSMFGNVNYYDENINVGLPIFTIHGNHDDLSGKGLTALDLLHEAGLVNLFGKHETIREFNISPILLRKGDTRLALYGLGSQRDDRLVRAFQEDNVTFFRPNAGAEDWFNLFVLHQNRPRRCTHRTNGGYLPENLIPQFFDLLLWGHEHECKKEPQYVASSEAVGDGFYILQPGSTVATSLTEEEALQKHVFLVKIKGRKFASKPIPLETTRPMVVEELVLDKMPPGVKITEKSGRPKDRQSNYIDEIAIESKISEMIKKANLNRGPRQPKLPLIRLKVIYEGEWANVQAVNTKRIGMRYEDVVANALDMIVTKKKTVRNRDASARADIPNMDDERLGNISATNLEFIVNDYFSKLAFKDKMTVLKPSDIGRALEYYADVEEKTSMTRSNADFTAALTNQMELVRSTLRKMPLPSLETMEDMGSFRDSIAKDLMDLKRTYYERTKDGTIVTIDEENEDDRNFSYALSSSHADSRVVDYNDDDSDGIQEVPPPKKTAATRGRGRRGAATTTSSTTSRAATKRKKDASFF